MERRLARAADNIGRVWGGGAVAIEYGESAIISCIDAGAEFLSDSTR
jgi:hypothetical protein